MSRVRTRTRGSGHADFSRPRQPPMPWVLAGGTARGDFIMFKRRTPRADGQPRFGDRRKAKRQTAGWEGRYRVVDESREHLHYAYEDF